MKEKIIFVLVLLYLNSVVATLNIPKICIQMCLPNGNACGNGFECCCGKCDVDIRHTTSICKGRHDDNVSNT